MNNYVSSLTGTSDNVSRGFIAVAEWTPVAQSVAVSYYGFAIVANALYVSTQQIGISTGANVYAALELAKKVGPNKKILTVSPSNAERYLSTELFDQ